MYRIKICSLAIFLMMGLQGIAQKSMSKKDPNLNTTPKLVVGIVVDQMRWDYLYRYQNQYVKGGFQRLLGEGFTCENTMIPYMPTYTAPGHTCVYTGSVPAIHGIVGNNWFNKVSGKVVYCTEDSTASTVGSKSQAGKMSPKNLWTTTITDELRLSTNFRSKVIGIALKDRGAILPAGHSGNAAYWYDDAVGQWITSTHYMAQLPTWVDSFNAKQLPAQYMAKDWELLYPADQYTQSTADDQSWENKIKGLDATTFPHKLSTIVRGKFDAFKTTPFANTYTFEFAKSAIKNEALGKNSVTDFLAVSISSTDYIGHSFGPNSMEIQDTYLRLDKDIADFLQYLDASVGKGNYTVFLTADHGVAHVPAFMRANKIPGGNIQDDDVARELNKLIEEKYAINKAITNLQNYQVYLKADLADKRSQIVDLIIQTLKEKDYIVNAFELEKLSVTTLPEPQKYMLANGYNPKRSGDIQFVLKTGYFDGGSKGTTHGLWNPYDAHIPLVFFGNGIKKGSTNRETYMTDISATIAALLHIQMPSGCVGKVITEVIGK